jgi:hypothetical protein
VIDRSPATTIVVGRQVSDIAPALAHALPRHFDRAIVAENAIEPHTVRLRQAARLAGMGLHLSFCVQRCTV